MPGATTARAVIVDPRGLMILNIEVRNGWKVTAGRPGSYFARWRILDLVGQWRRVHRGDEPAADASRHEPAGFGQDPQAAQPAGIRLYRAAAPGRRRTRRLPGGCL